MCTHFARVLKAHNYTDFLMDMEAPGITTHFCPPPPNEENIPLGSLGFSFRDDRIMAYSLIPCWDLSRHSLKALRCCNHWNLTALFPMAVYQDGRIACSQLWFVAETPTDGFIWENIFLPFFISSCACFLQVRKEFPFLPEENIYHEDGK